MAKNEDRLGERRRNNQGELMEIIEYISSRDLTVRFIGTNTTKKCAYKEFKNGHVRDNFYPSVCGVGYIGDTSITMGNRQVKQSYKVWSGMLLRCYSNKHRNNNPSYVDCWVCKEWLCYANFEKWYDDNYYEICEEKMQLDKDILVKGNKIYSPQTCVFVPQRINALFTKHDAGRGKYPIGVHYSRANKKFEATPSGKHKWLGYYDSVEDAFRAYKKCKEEHIKEVANEYKDFIPKTLYDALCGYEVEIDD